MKPLLLTLPLISLVGCQDPGTNDGYDAGFRLTCGFSWSPKHKFVTDQEFSYNFLAGAKACAQEHPELARKELGLDRGERIVSAREADKRLETATENQGEVPPPAPVPVKAVDTPVEPAKDPIKAKASATPAAPAKAKASAKTQAPVKTRAPAKSKAPVKTTGPAKSEPSVPTKAPKKADVSVPAKVSQKAAAPADAKTPIETKAPVEAVEVTSHGDQATAPVRRVDSPSVPSKPMQQTPRKRTPTSYETFLGE